MKTVWIVDGAYMLKAVPPGEKLDYLKLKSVLEQQNECCFAKSYYLNSIPNPLTEAQDSFHRWLMAGPPRGPGMYVQLYTLKEMSVCCPECGHHFSRQVQKGVDVGIATLILRLAIQDQYERLILSAGDGDFEDAICYVKTELHREVWISGFAHSLSADLQSYADRVIFFDNHWSALKKSW